MLTIEDKELSDLLGRCAVLRGQGRVQQAIELVEPRLGDMDQDAKQAALLQLIYAANELGDKEQCREFAEQLAKIDPEIPSVKRVLEAYRG